MKFKGPYKNSSPKRSQIKLNLTKRKRAPMNKVYENYYMKSNIHSKRDIDMDLQYSHCLATSSHFSLS